MAERFMGEMKPFYGKWNWPLRDMQPGEYFIVDHARRAPEAVRSYVSMAAARLGKYVSVMANDPEHPGFTRVTCTPPPTEREELCSVMDYEKLHAKLADWYGVDLNSVVPWYSFAIKKVDFIPAKRLKLPPCGRMVVRTELREGWFGLIFRPDGMEFHPLPAGTSSTWKLEPTLEEIMQ